jgi:hypothetical protein
MYAWTHTDWPVKVGLPSTVRVRVRVPLAKSFTRTAETITSNHQTQPLRHLQVSPIRKASRLVLTQSARVVQKRLRSPVQLRESLDIGLAVLGLDRHGQIVSSIWAMELTDHSSVIATVSTYADNDFWSRVATEHATVENGVDDSNVS